MTDKKQKNDGRAQAATEAGQLHAAGCRGYNEQNGTLTVVIPMDEAHPELKAEGQPVHIRAQRIARTERGWGRNGDSRRTGRLFGKSEKLFRYLSANDDHGTDVATELVELTKAAGQNAPTPGFDDVLDAFGPVTAEQKQEG